MATVVKAQPGDSVDSLIRKFIKKVQNEGILAEMKKREFYIKPSLARQQAQQERARKIAKAKRQNY